MQYKTLLLNSTMEAISFISERKAFKLLWKAKVDIVDEWEDIKILWGDRVINHPAVLKLKYYVYKKYGKLVFSRRACFRRDQYRCQYCKAELTYKSATLEHVIPISRGGPSSFLNCVAACSECNLKKGFRTLEESGMKLLRQPFNPMKTEYFFMPDDCWHEGWNFFI